MKTPAKVSLILLLVGLVGATLTILCAGTGAGGKSALSVGKTESHSNLSSTSTTCSSENAGFSSRRILLFSNNPHPLNRRIVAALAAQLKDCPFIEQLEVTNGACLLTCGTNSPDLFLTINLAGLKQSGLVASSTKSKVTASLGNAPWESVHHSSDASTPPVVDFAWNASLETDTTFTGVRSDRDGDTAHSIAEELAKAICKQIEEMAGKYPPLPPLPGEFYGPYQPVADFPFLKLVQGRRALSYCGLFTHNQTFWQFQAPTNPAPLLYRIAGDLESGGWKIQDQQLTNTMDYNIRARSPDGAQLEIFRQRTGGLDLESLEAKLDSLPFVVRYRQPFSRPEREAAIEKLFAAEHAVDWLLPFQNSFSSAQRQRFYELAEKSPATSPQVCLQLANLQFDRRRTNDAIRLLIQAKALAATVKDNSALTSSIEDAARKISPKRQLKLEVTADICRELGFLELTNADQTVEQERTLGQSLILFGPGNRGLKICALNVGAPRSNAYPWYMVEDQDGSRSSSWSTFSLPASGEWQHSFTFDEKTLELKAVPVPEKNRVKFIIRAKT